VKWRRVFSFHAILLWKPFRLERRQMPSANRPIAVLLAVTTLGGHAIAQSYYDDPACRQYADQQTAPLRAQAGSQAVGSTLLGAGLGAALGGAIGGGRGAGIGAASGAIAGTGIGAANAQNTAAYAQQQWYAFYGQCMQARQASPAYPPGYGAPSGYPPGYASPQPAPDGGPTTSDLNRQQLNQIYSTPQSYPPAYPSPPAYR
jgi:hypothetical protein